MTADEIMRWLPSRIRDPLIASTPCTGGAAHDWSHERQKVRQGGRTEPVLIYEHWECDTCGIVVQFDPKGIA